ncbi:MAG: reverse transcriptase domain-containing protein, partial [Ktedonobacteraceae bacterium]
MKDKKEQKASRPQQITPLEDKEWHNLPWRAFEQQVLRIQKHIYQASQRCDRLAVHSQQQLLLESEAARMLAVRHVAQENEGKDTAGVDGVKSVPPKGCLALVAGIHPDHWKQHPPRPVLRVWIPKPGMVERRPLAILTMIDRCKQELAKMALEPEWEAQFETHSYGYRPGRGTQDAIAAIIHAIEHHPSFVFVADIERAFDHVNQSVVLEKLQTFPVLRQAIHAWLTAGVMDGNTYYASKTGIAQGGVLSPLLMNVALHGMEAVVTEGHSKEPPLLVRYADDFVILHADLKELQQAVRRV